jgi:3,4-dihydroxy 2-butanone 4-phosphate synthase/GTP cyclohydrolase II
VTIADLVTWLGDRDLDEPVSAPEAPTTDATTDTITRTTEGDPA